mmetsp:Transcript_1684/g.2222  ORF Transcript_1684/g.2222 Transcript_1684/m.2222 type:complete len:419 (-) Transcript_1684:136-1392(-)
METENTNIDDTIDCSVNHAVPRFIDAQKNRTLIFPKLPQPTEENEINHLQLLTTCMPCYEEEPAELLTTAIEAEATTIKTELNVKAPQHSFVIIADSQLGMRSLNLEWETELNYCRQAVTKINALHPRPKFVSMCGDIVDMEQSFYYNNPKALRNFDSLEECERIQDRQNEDFKEVFGYLHEDIALVCLCGNHDIGNRPTPKSIETYRNAFGDEYLAFWANGSYNICLNNVLFNDPSAAMELYNEQLLWLEDRLKYAVSHEATQIFVFGHHPWFLYNENEDVEDLGDYGSAFPEEWDDGSGRFDDMLFPDSYFTTPKKYRMHVMELFEKYNVSASFSGHYHQNLVSKTSFGMDMIITGPLSMVFDSNSKPENSEENGRGFRVVEVFADCATSVEEFSQEGMKTRKLGCGRFKHQFQSI